MGREFTKQSLTLRDKGTEIAKLIFSTTLTIQQRFGINYVTSILMGSNLQKIKAHNHDKNPEFGALKDYSFDQIRAWVKELIENGYLEQTKDEYPVLKTTPKTEPVLRNLERVNLSEPDPNLERKPFIQKGESVAKTLEAYKQGKPITEIATERGLAIATILSHLAEAFEQGENLDIDLFVDKQKQQTISQAFEKVGLDYLSPVKKALDTSVSWEDLKWVRAKIIREQQQDKVLSK